MKAAEQRAKDREVIATYQQEQYAQYMNIASFSNPLSGPGDKALATCSNKYHLVQDKKEESSEREGEADSN